MANDKQELFDPESSSMKISRLLGLRKLRWSLRRAYTPVPSDALVLEVGAGGNPYPRANVLLDAMETTIERNEQQLVTDRPLILGVCENLPFKDKSFDFVIASHVLEHSSDPEKFLTELMRVAKAGYIETPDGWFEKMCAFTYHRLEVSVDGNKLLINKKPDWKYDQISHLWDIKLANSKELAKFLRLNPELNHLRFYWKEKIHFEIHNPEVDANWAYPESVYNRLKAESKSLIFLIRNIYLKLRRTLLSQNKRNKNINVLALLRCPTCHHIELEKIGSIIMCKSCSSEYDVVNEIPRIFPKELSGINANRQ